MPHGGMSFVDARDVAAGLIAAMHNGRGGERYLMGGANWKPPVLEGWEPPEHSELPPEPPE